MNLDVLKAVILDQHRVIEKAEIVGRSSVSLFDGVNYIITGLRRAGKSTLLYQKVQDLVANGVSWTQIIYINFEDESLDGFSLSDFNDILSVQAQLSDAEGYFFFDEIQNVEGWEKFARRMADYKEKVCITGSNAVMLSSQRKRSSVAATLAGMSTHTVSVNTWMHCHSPMIGIRSVRHVVGPLSSEPLRIT